MESSSNAGTECAICKRAFAPDPRSGDKQKCCGRARCRREYKKLWRRRKYALNAEFQAEEKVRVGRWRRANPGYWKRSCACSGSDPPLVLQIRHTAERVQRLEQAVCGLALHGTGCGGAELAQVMAGLADAGRQAVNVGAG